MDWPPESGAELAAVLTAVFEDAVGDLMGAVANGGSEQVVETARQRILDAGRTLAAYAGARYDPQGAELGQLRELVMRFGPRLEGFG